MLNPERCIDDLGRANKARYTWLEQWDVTASEVPPMGCRAVYTDGMSWNGQFGEKTENV